VGVIGARHTEDSLLDAAPCGFVAFVDDGTVRLVNRTLVEMLGMERDAIVGRHVENILTVGSKIFYQTHLFPLLRLHGHVEEIFLLFRVADGSDMGALVNAVRRERDGEWVVDCVVMRVRERRKFEDALLRAKQEAETARATSEARGAELQAANTQLEQQALELEMSQQQLSEQAQELDTQREELQVMNDELLERSRELERQRGIAEEANRAKSAFLAAMSHELRTPLNAIGGYVQLLEMGIHGPVTAAQMEALQKVARSQRHLLRLINEVLNLARIEAGGVHYEMRRVVLREVVDAVLPMVEPQMSERGLSCRIDVPADLAVHADRDKAEQVLLNLLGNAVKFTPRGGRVRIDAVRDEQPPPRVRLNVEDTGIGIPADRLEQAFEPFVQVSADPTRRAEGTGLGLAISRDLARGMGGELTARSGVGRGSTFTLELPAA
jgi:PAS domain S-box-containing protein